MNAPDTPLRLREPAHQVSERAPAYWRLSEAISAVIWLVLAIGVAVTAILVPHGFWTWIMWVAVVIFVLAPVPGLTFVPTIRFRIHRWEVTDIAVHVRHGWLTVVDEIVPLSRVQTVDSTQGPLMRRFGLRTVKVSTASSAGTVQIACLDDALALEVVAKLVAITAATPEDAT
ncbi:membrane protein YdbS with pleckstrin-like domain [Nocardioides luteus]|uniref:Membrane protein n=1 Tax=Nocardioides luteus TaxID=1844 RepID=A0ABQ5SUH3_9ACTN|nr:PH domain-containing protein [Nocardioides luteus]MDR7309435.1 membrane protein YdbS with pleckstrin-like domain [Nocardioides luteus]GGR51219.1 membrane protein [Nocardioides luteus]GLJ67842.1 membrane protein [Nocardioides luteus]